jgi:AraC-like DNA-binding protein
MKPAPTYESSRFLKKLDEEIDIHLSDTTLTVSRLTRLIGMSRTDLHRKLKGAVGMSASGYIRKVRLEKAAEMLQKESESSIYQIAMEVGFENQSYFSKRFKEMFGRKPVEWRYKNQ